MKYFENKVQYNALKGKQKEIYNFQKVSAHLADYGYTTIKLDDDWMGADFIAIHFDGVKYLKVDLRLTKSISVKKYLSASLIKTGLFILMMNCLNYLN